MPHPNPFCRIEPLGNFQFSFRYGKRELTRWCFSPLVPRPYFFPVNGPSGHSLTRMGHPGAPNHDHHRSLWFAHSDLIGQDFWSEDKPARIVQRQWYAIQEHDDHARLGVELHWLDGHDPKPLLRQDLFMTIRPNNTQWTMELQSDFRSGGEGISFRKSNFGILGLRVAKSLSVVFGSGRITGSDGQTDEAGLFGKSNRWVDYCGTSETTLGGNHVIEGISVIDHCKNPNYPTKWHVRDDGWIGPSLSRDNDVGVNVQSPLTVRYLINVHRGPANPDSINSLADDFDQRPPVRVIKGTKPHHQWELA